MKRKFNYSVFLYAIVFNFILFYEPFLYAGNIINYAGALNPIASPLLASLVIIYVVKKNVGVSIYYLFILSYIAVFFTLINQRGIIELFRDLNYISIILLLIGTNLELIKNKQNIFAKNITLFIKGYIFLQLVIPIVLFPILFQDSRLPLNNLSDTNSALVLCFLIFSYLMMELKGKTLIWVLGLVLVILSGSRAAFALYIIGGIIFRNKLFPNIHHKRYYLITSIIAMLLLIFIYRSIGLTDFRVASMEDITKGQGSFYSRLNWYLIMFDILNSNWLAGFGAGYAEKAVGKIVHNDVLRFWIDYSILFPLIFYGFFFRKMFDASPIEKIFAFARGHFKENILVMLSLILTALYNGFQDLNVVIAFVIFFSVVCYTINRNIHHKNFLLYKC